MISPLVLANGIVLASLYKLEIIVPSLNHSSFLASHVIISKFHFSWICFLLYLSQLQSPGVHDPSRTMTLASNLALSSDIPQLLWFIFPPVFFFFLTNHRFDYELLLNKQTLFIIVSKFQFHPFQLCESFPSQLLFCPVPHIGPVKSDYLGGRVT